MATFWSTVPTVISSTTSWIQATSSGSVFNLANWILYQRLSILPQFFLVPNTQYYMTNFALAFILGAVGLYALLALSLKKIKNLPTIFLLLALVSIFITAKAEGLLPDSLAVEIFSAPIINTLRSPDKTFVFLPFFFLAAIYIGLQDFYTKKFSNPIIDQTRFRRILRPTVRKIVLVSFLLILISVFPFFVGGIQTSYSYAFNNGENYQTSPNSFLVHIPNDYYDAARILSQDGTASRIVNLPSGVINSINWVNYPQWKVIGTDPTMQLFSQPSLQANAANSPFGDEWNSASVDNSSWIIQLMSLYNVQYLIYHKDVADVFINQTRDKINFLQKQGYIKLIGDYDNFELYNLSAAYFLPQIYTSSSLVLINGSSAQMLSSIISDPLNANATYFLSSETSTDQWRSLLNYDKNYENNETAPQILFQEINPTHYQVRIDNATHPFFLVFSESYNPLWKAYVNNVEEPFNSVIANYTNFNVAEAQSTVNLTPSDINYLFANALPDSSHYMVNGYANAWYIDPAEIPKDQNGTLEITIFFEPQSLYFLGISISGVTFITCAICLVAQTTFFKSLYLSLKRRTLKYSCDL
jgi:hypothetical protein